MREEGGVTLARAITLSLVIAVFCSAHAFAKAAGHDFHSLTNEEKSIFYPMVCDGPPDPESAAEHTCDKLANNLSDTPAAGGRIDMTFTKIGYGSYTVAGGDEALVFFNSNLDGEVDRGMGAALFVRKGKWNLEHLIVSSMMNECIIIPSHGEQKMLCLDAPMACCGQSYNSINIVTMKMAPGMDFTENKILASHNGRLDNTDDIENFCSAGKNSETLLTSIDKLRPSTEPDISAEAEVEYITPDEMNKACDNHEPESVKTVQGVVRFIFGNEKAKILFPAGIRDFYVY